jgi:beta-glucanase (GH16 family)
MRLRHVREMVALAVLGIVWATAARAQTWTQVWSDEFGGSNGSALSGSTWTYDVGGGGWGNNELQYYQSGTANVWQTGGYMQIQARVQSVGGYAYTSARAKTQGLRSFGPGDATPVKIEARIQGTQGQGLLPAFWTLGANIASVPWPGCGEIDIMEHVNTVADANMTLHWNNGGHVQQGFGTASVGSTFEQWHTYAITWTSTTITAVVDGVSRGSMSIANNVNSTEEFHWPHFLLANIAVGGNWPGPPNSSTTFPAYLNVDYIRYSTASGTGSTPTATARPRATATATVRARATATATPSGGQTIANGTYRIMARHSGRALDAAGTGDGANVQQWAYGGGSNQRWTVTHLGSGQYQIQNVAAGKALDVAGVGTANGTNVHIWTYVGGNNQKWTITATSGGFYRLSPVHAPSLALDVSGVSTADGANVHVWSYLGQNNQQWAFLAP